MAGPNEPGRNWRPWTDYVPTNADYTQRQLDRDMNVYDAPLNIEDQVARYQGLSDFLTKQTAPNLPGGWDVRHKLMNTAPELIRGPSNFSQAPYDWYDPRAMMKSLTSELKADPKLDKNIEAAVWPNQFEDIYVNPAEGASTTSSLLGHEPAHTGQSRYDARLAALGPKASMPQKQANLWTPGFSLDFMDELVKAREKKDSPYFKKYGFGTSEDETLAFLMGREAELPAGKTLMDDPYTRNMFLKNFGAYDQYTKARDKIRAIYKETKRNAPR